MVRTHNISSNNIEILVRKDTGAKVNSVHITNTHATSDVNVDLFIDNDSKTYYILKNKLIKNNDFLIIDNFPLPGFSRESFSLYIKLTGSDSTTGSADIILK